MRFCFVSFGEDPERFICPKPPSLTHDMIGLESGGDPQTTNPVMATKITDFAFFDRRPYPWFSFDDYDAATLDLPGNSLTVGA